jgi:6-phosphogluconolactonase
MRTQTGLIGRFALYALLGSPIAFAACGDDDGGGGSSPTGGTAGKGSGGTAGKGGSATVGGSSTGGASKGGSQSQGGNADPSGGAPPEAGGGGTPGEGGTAGEAGGAPGGAPSEGGVSGAETSGGAGGMAGADAGGAAGAGGEAGAPVLADAYHVYVGCSDSKGTVQLYLLERSTNALTPSDSVQAGSALSAGAIGPDADRFYVSHESEGLITTLSRELDTGDLEVRSAEPVPYEAAGGAGGSSGLNPGTHALRVHPSGDYLYAANFAASSVYAYQLQTDGDLGDLLDSAEDGENPDDVAISASGTHVLIPYSGSDDLGVYLVDSDGDLNLVGTLLDFDAGDAPRVLSVHPNGRWVYSIDQNDNSVSMLTFDDNDGSIEITDTTDMTFPGGYTGDSEHSTIAIRKDGRFAYVGSSLDSSIDGSINIFTITPTGNTAGRLTLLASGGTVSSQGESLWDIAISDDDNLLVAVNRDDDNLVIFNMNVNGGLTYQQTRAVCDEPTFVRIVTP